MYQCLGKLPHHQEQTHTLEHLSFNVSQEPGVKVTMAFRQGQWLPSKDRKKCRAFL